MNVSTSWRQLTTRTAYENPWIRVVEDQVVRPDGTDGIYGVVEIRNTAVVVVALDEQDRVLLLDVDRYTVGLSIEVPAGGSDGEDPLVGAQRELLEETGFEASEWTQIGQLNALNGICRADAVVFLARDLHKTAEGHDQVAEGISLVRWVPWREVLDMIRSGDITDSEAISSLMFAALHLQRAS